MNRKQEKKKIKGANEYIKKINFTAYQAIIALIRII